MYFYTGHRETETETLEEAKKILETQSITQATNGKYASLCSKD